MNRTSVTINSEDKDRLYEIMKFTGFQRQAKKSAEVEVTYLSKVIKEWMTYATKNKDIYFKLAPKQEDSSASDIEKTIILLKDLVTKGSFDGEVLVKIKENRLYNIFADLRSTLQDKYVRVNQKNQLYAKFIEMTRKDTSLKHEIVNTYGSLPRALKDLIQPIYQEILRLKYDTSFSLKKKAPMTFQQQVEYLTIKSKIDNFDNIDLALTNLKKVLFDLELYTGSKHKENLRQKIKANIAEAPEDTQNSLIHMLKVIESAERQKNSYSDRYEKDQQNEKKMQQINQRYFGLREDYQRLREESERVNSQNEELQSYIEQFRQKNVDLQAQIVELNKQIEQIPEQKNEALNNSAFSELCDHLTIKNAQLQTKIQEEKKQRKQIIQSAKIKIKSVQSKNTELEAKNRTLQMKIEQLAGRKERELKAVPFQNSKYQDIIRENQDLHKRVEQYQDLQIELRVLRDKCDALETDHAEKERKQLELDGQIKRLEQQLEQAKQDLLRKRRWESDGARQKVTAQKMEQTKRWQDLQDRIQKLGNQNQRLSEENRILQGKVSTAQKKTEKMGDMVSIAELQEERRKFRKAVSESQVLQSKIDALILSNQSLERKVNENEVAKADGESAIIQLLRKNYDNASQEVCKLKEIIESQKKQLDKKSIEIGDFKKMETDKSKANAAAKELEQNYCVLLKEYQEQTIRMNDLMKEVKKSF